MRIVILVIATVCATFLPAQARVVALLSYQELANRSDLVIIATPTARTRDTGEVSDFPGLSSVHANGRNTTVQCVGVETPFQVAAVLKGDSEVRNVILHHCREKDPTQVEINGPGLVLFDPLVPARFGTYLLFLVREPDGRYAPANGQTDPAIKAISKLPFPEIHAPRK